MGNYFEIHYNAIKYPIDSEKSRGLRNAQLGAIHAISSFFTLNKKDAAIVIMPTGSGKTAVLMLTPYLIRKQRVLVVTRSKMVCGQIAEDFSELRTLCVANVFNTSIKKPNVFELEHLYTKEYQKDLEQADVIVATPSCALSLSESDWAKENIDLVEVDEAHHTPAKTWQQILVNLSAATHVLFTATPFRLDRKELSGEIVLPEFKIANAVIHFDEASPHMHVVGVPVWEGAKRGLSKKVSKRNVFTPQTLSVILQDKLREEASYGFECYFKEQLAEKKKGRNHDLSVTWRDCWRVWRRWLEKFIKK